MTTATIGADIERLNDRFGIAGALEFGAREGYVVVRVATAECRAEIALYGAHLLSWQPAGEADLLWCAPLPPAESKRPIRGGVPICWPWFGPHATDAAKPQHGLVRTEIWSVEETARTGAGVAVTLATALPGAELRLTVVAGRRLELGLRTTNAGDAPLTITEALHTYFRVGAIDAVAVDGLDGCRYRDNTDGGQWKTQQGPVEAKRETIALFDETPDRLAIVDTSLGRRIAIARSGGRSSVVWNPGANAPRLGDVPTGGERSFICVESANIWSSAVTIGPGSDHTLAVTYAIAGLR